MSSSAPKSNANALLLPNDPNANPKAPTGTTIKLPGNVSLIVDADDEDYNAVMESEERAYGGYSNTAAGKRDAKADRDKVKSTATMKQKAFTKAEDDAILRLYEDLGPKWVQIKEAEPLLFQNRIPRTIGNRYHNHLSKKKSEKKETKGTDSTEMTETTKMKKGKKGKKRKTSTTKTSKEKKQEHIWDAEFDSDADIDPNSDSEEIITEPTHASRADRAKKRRSDKENIQNLTEELCP